ncbi:MAG: prolipoprotein diacylglyceryl transferase, partial [Planctomycetota bacterium]
MFPILFEFPNFWDQMSGQSQLIEALIGVAASLIWLSLALRKSKGKLAAAASWIAFLFIAHLLVSQVMRDKNRPGEIPITIYTFSVMILLGFLMATWHILRQTRPLKVPDTAVFDFCMWMLLIGIVGSRLLYAFLNWDQFRTNKWEIAMIWHGGLVWYGGFIPGLLAAPWLMRKYKLPGLVMADITASAIMLGLSLGRWGCLCAGDDYGQTTDRPWGIKFFHERALVAAGFKEGEGVALHPTQIYMSLNCIWLYFVLEWIRRNSRYAGGTLAWLIILYALTRAVLIEPFRGDFAERNPGLEKHLAVELDVERAADGPDVHLQRGTSARSVDQNWEGGLLGDLVLEGDTTRATVYVMTVDAIPGAKGPRPPFRESPRDWDVTRIEGLPPGVRVTSGRARWYDSDLGVPVNYVSTSQWISIPMLIAGVGLLVFFRRRKAPGYDAALAEAQA